MEKFKLSKTDIPGVLVIEPHAFADNRGFFMEYYNKDEYAKIGFNEVFIQDNHSSSKKGVVRGLHYQLNPNPMGKLIKVIKGKVFDVGVDLRKGSPTYGRFYAQVLSEDNKKMLYFPPGFAHGFLSLADGTEVVYKCTGMFNGESERALLWNDPALMIPWPLDMVGEIIVSERDKKHPLLSNVETNFSYK